MEGKPLLRADLFTKCWTGDLWHLKAAGQLITLWENTFLLTVVIQSEASQATHWCTKETCVRQAVLSLGYHPPERWTDLDWAGLEKKSDESSEVKPSQNTTLVQYHQVQVMLTKLQQQRACPSLPSPEPCFQALSAALGFQLSTPLCCIYFVR